MQESKVQDNKIQERKMVRKRDALILLTLFVLAGGIWFFIQSSNEEVGARVYGEIHFGQNLIKVVPLYNDQIFSAGPNPNVIFEVQDGSIAFSKSDCPDQVCVHTGFIYKRHHFAACLPNSLLLMIREEEE